jgi:Flp pilus assembly pilin Flp
MPNLRNRQGQGLVEYIILIALMGIALVVTIRTLGKDTKAKFNTADTTINGL